MCLGPVVSMCYSFSFNSFEGQYQDEISNVVSFYRAHIISGAWMLKQCLCMLAKYWNLLVKLML
jgi:hypothetical protein